MKTLIGCIVGAIAIAGAGFTYDVTRAGLTESVVDVRVVEVGGHEYVVATSFCPHHMTTTDANAGSGRNSNFSKSIVSVQSGGSTIALMHHVGCKACPVKQ